MIGFAHPLAALAAFVAAPITSLIPLIGAGYVVAFTQVMLVPPTVKEFVNLSNDLVHVKRWWSNRVLRVFLVFALSGFGSSIGTYVGAFKIFGSFFSGS